MKKWIIISLVLILLLVSFFSFVLILLLVSFFFYNFSINSNVTEQIEEDSIIKKDGLLLKSLDIEEIGGQ